MACRCPQAAPGNEQWFARFIWLLPVTNAGHNRNEIVYLGRYGDARPSVARHTWTLSDIVSVSATWTTVNGVCGMDLHGNILFWYAWRLPFLSFSVAFCSPASFCPSFSSWVNKEHAITVFRLYSILVEESKDAAVFPHAAFEVLPVLDGMDRLSAVHLRSTGKALP